MSNRNSWLSLHSGGDHFWRCQRTVVKPFRSYADIEYDASTDTNDASDTIGLFLNTYDFRNNCLILGLGPLLGLSTFTVFSSANLRSSSSFLAWEFFHFSKIEIGSTDKAEKSCATNHFRINGLATKCSRSYRLHSLTRKPSRINGFENRLLK
jgi:hypothetical protein